MNYLIVSEKNWNKGLSQELSHLGKISLINLKRDFSIDRLHQLKPDKIFFAHWSYIIPKDILKEFECIVFHMTDLPFGRGGSPLQNLIARGIDRTKLSALRVSEGLDEGPIYLKKDLSLYGTAEEIFIRANDLISTMIKEIILNNLSPSPQVGEAVLFKRRTPDKSSINSINELNELFNHIRMLDASGYPHAYLDTPNFRLEFTRASLKADNSIIADVRITKK